MRALLMSGLLLVSATAALADEDRPVTAPEKASLETALKAQGCSGGHMKFDDDRYFEVDNATCADGHVYDFKFSSDFTLLSKEREH